MKPLKSIVVTIVAGAIMALSADAQVVVNGGFEFPGQPTQPPNIFLSVGATIPGWTVVGTGNVDAQQVNQLVPIWPGNSTQFIDLTGDTGGAGIQSGSITTAIGQAYEVTFDAFNGSLVDNDVGGTPQTGVAYVGPALSLQASGGILQPYILPAGVPQSPTYLFVATSTSTALTFMDLSGYDSNAGWIDNVAIQAVPEPMTVTILGLGALACINHLRMRRS
ncbi:MAG TPA: hypothetical protein VIK59_11900 [Verrucomicrobiae bacterium]